MKCFKYLILTALTCLTASAQSFTPAQAEKVVHAGIAYAKQNGMDKLVLQATLPHGVFHVGTGSELYLFVYDQKGKAIANGFQTELVGTSRWDVKDADGRYQVREFIKTAKSKGNGWVDYKFLNPITKTVEPKTTFVEAFDNYIFCCGIYKK